MAEQHLAEAGHRLLHVLLGGGAELLVGLLDRLVPGAGGLTYIARRAAEHAALSTNKDLLPFLTEPFTAAAAEVSG